MDAVAVTIPVVPSFLTALIILYWIALISAAVYAEILSFVLGYAIVTVNKTMVVPSFWGLVNRICNTLFGTTPPEGPTPPPKYHTLPLPLRHFRCS